MGRLKLGAFEKPLMLENESIHRTLISNNISKKELIFGNVKAIGFDHYLFNLAGNPFISKAALRIGTFLYAYFNEPIDKTEGVNWEVGEVFYISDKTETTDNYIGEDNFYCKARGYSIEYSRPLTELILLLSNFGIEIKASNLLKALTELHDFHYITISPRPLREVGNKKIYTRTCFRHIRLYRGMIDKPFYYYLNNKTVHKRNRSKSGETTNGNVS